MASNWIKTNPAADVAGSIRHAIRAAQFLSDDPQAWKWVMLALHSALQGACVCHLVTTAEPVGAVTKRNTDEWLLYFDSQRTNSNTERPKTYLMALPDLLKAVKEPHSAGDRSGADGVAIGKSELVRLCRFHTDIRNQFVHFEPKLWSIEMSGIPELVKLIVRIIGEILEIDWAFRHLSLAQREEMLRNLQMLDSFQWPV